ncbi:COX assembly mitochondrial protein homolog [Hylaeus volcanicus]|uniref:COX assembly mitochondrial protein homolog n=1 Tax=Hylaeus volcanicus TaxID=313075 RepID=UPI0023B85D8E|nr:COX assembly mitochondrial protein homolog [Hylaeus volcanicus]
MVSESENMKIMSENVKRSVLTSKYSGGSHNLGDPNDKSLRKVETEVLIPQKMRQKAKEEKCSEEVKEFAKCCTDSSYLMVIKCRDQNSALKACLTKWYTDEKFKELCTQEYIEERSAYRRTGIKQGNLHRAV